MIATVSMKLHIPCDLVEAEKLIAKKRGINLEESISRAILQDVLENQDYVPFQVLKKFVNQKNEEV